MTITYSAETHDNGNVTLKIFPESGFNGFFGMIRTIVDVPKDGAEAFIEKRVNALLAQELGDEIILKGGVTIVSA